MLCWVAKRAAILIISKTNSVDSIYITHHVISQQVSFSFHSISFLLDKI